LNQLLFIDLSHSYLLSIYPRTGSSRCLESPCTRGSS